MTVLDVGLFLGCGVILAGAAMIVHDLCRKLMAASDREVAGWAIVTGALCGAFALMWWRLG